MQLRLERWTLPTVSLLLVTDDDGALAHWNSLRMNPACAGCWAVITATCTLDEGAAPASLTQALKAYFAGDIDALADVPTATAGTPFQREVWNALRAIPAGTTISYGQLAAKLGREGASRAVGAANGANPIPIVVPCHRVIGADGSLTGFGSGLGRKQWLLDHDRRFAPVIVGA